MEKEEIANQGEERHTNKELYEREVKLLDTFLQTGAITKQQHDYSLKCLTEKMVAKGVIDPPKKK